jgi:hypothetical protein
MATITMGYLFAGGNARKQRLPRADESAAAATSGTGDAAALLAGRVVKTWLLVGRGLHSFTSQLILSRV